MSGTTLYTEVTNTEDPTGTETESSSPTDDSTETDSGSDDPSATDGADGENAATRATATYGIAGALGLMAMLAL